MGTATRIGKGSITERQDMDGGRRHTAKNETGMAIGVIGAAGKHENAGADATKGQERPRNLKQTRTKKRAPP